MTLMTPGRCFVTWVDDANDPRVDIDICLPPEKNEHAWTYVELELDVFRHEPDVVEVKDRRGVSTLVPQPVDHCARRRSRENDDGGDADKPRAPGGTMG